MLKKEIIISFLHQIFQKLQKKFQILDLQQGLSICSKNWNLEAFEGSTKIRDLNKIIQ